MKKKIFILLLTIFLLQAPSFAYIDPGTGSMLFSIVLGSCATLFFLLNSLLIKLKMLFYSKKDLYKNNIPFVIYSEGKQYFNVFKPIIDEFEKREIPLVFYTSSKDDSVFENEYKFVKSEYIGQGLEAYTKLAFLRADICLMTTPGLDVFHLKRSKYVKYYCHIFHAVASSMGYRLFSLDYYDGVLLNGEFQKDIIRTIENKRNMPNKELPIVGCTYIDIMQEKLNTIPINKENDNLTILIAPTWGESGLLTKYGNSLIDKLVETEWNIIIRPHPQSLKVEKNIIEELKDRYKNNKNLTWNTDVENLNVLAKADIMISDFSSVIFDYAFLFNRPVIYVNNEINKEIYDFVELDDDPWLYKKIKKIGVELTKENFENIKSIVENLNQNEEIKKEIEIAKQEAWQKMGESGKFATDFLVAKQKEIAECQTSYIK